MKIERLAPFIVLTFIVLVLCSCVPTVGQAEGWPGVTSHNGLLYTASGDGSIMAINSSARSQNLRFPQRESGEWSFRIVVPAGGMGCGPSTVPAAFYSAPVVTDDLVYVAAYNGEILAMSPSARSQNLTFPQRGDGEWVFELPGNVVGSPVMDGDILYVPCSDGRVYGLDAVYGDLKWRSGALGEKLWTGPAIKGATLYVGTFEDDIYALPTAAASSGDDVEPSLIFEGDAGFVSSPVLDGDVLFVGSLDRNLYAIDAGKSEEVWRFAAGNWFWAAPEVREGAVYAGCLDGKVYALDAETGDELWRFDTTELQPRDSVVASPVLADDLLVVACDSGEVYILRTDIVVDERRASTISIGSPIRGSICAREGTAYIRAQNDWLYAVDIEEGTQTWGFRLTTE